MKRITALIILAAALILAASACVSSEQSAEESELPTVEPTPVTPIVSEAAAQEDETPEAQPIEEPVATETDEQKEEAATTAEPSGAEPEPKPAKPIQTMEPAETPVVDPEEPEEQPERIEREADKMIELRIDGVEVSVAWEDNESVTALRELLADGAITVQMSMYGGFEQVGPLGASLPRNDAQTTTSPGDIVLYSGNQIVVFYGSNSWAYTRLGKITGLNAQELRTLLGNGNVTLTLE